ncbi:unnamed protein product, partial [Gongylonema pulchrum]|uniref:ZM domain-containing protein n=1 Tax=Gongylonema pulchrum TaxID=637853 RepID=A0A183CXX4_9BILA
EVTEHSCLPWQLTEKDNQITVDHIKPQRIVNYDSYKRERTDKYTTRTKSDYEVPIAMESSRHRTSGAYQKSEVVYFNDTFDAKDESGISRPHNLAYQAAPFTNVTNTGSPYAGNIVRQKQGFQNSYTADSYTRTESRNTSGYGSFGDAKPVPGAPSVPPKVFGSSVPSSATTTGQPAPATDATGRAYTPMRVDTRDAHGGAGYHSVTSPGRYIHSGGIPVDSSGRDSRGRVVFQHSPRTERQLSPHATVRHLQYNSPMNIYSPQSAAEQYLQQTGGRFGIE